METTLERENDSTLKVTVSATADEVAPAVERAVRKLGSEVKVPGFRKGKVPRKVLESRVGRDALREAALREAIPEILAKALDEQEDVAPIAPPAVEVTSYDLDGALAFDATVEVRPDIELPNFELLSVERPDAAATDEEVEQQLQRLQERFATLETVERPARAGDYVLCDIHGTIHGQEIDVLSGADQLYEVGSAWPVPEFDTEIEGSRAGDILKFNAVLPAEAEGEHAGDEVTFQVLVKETRQKILPGLDDEFAKNASEFETLDELRVDLRERIGKVKAIQVDADVRNRLLEQLLEEVEFTPPESLVRSEMAYRLQRFDEQLKQAGMTFDQYMESQEFTEEQVEQDLRRQAERNVRAQLILEDIGRREGLQVSEDELREEVRYHAESMRADPSELAKQLSEGGRLMALAGDIIRRKALNLLVEKADIKEEARDEQAEEAGSPALEEDGGTPDA